METKGSDSNIIVETLEQKENYVKIGENLVIDKRSMKKHPSFESFVSSEEKPQAKKELRRDPDNIARLTSACSTILVPHSSSIKDAHAKKIKMMYSLREETSIFSIWLKINCRKILLIVEGMFG